MSLESPTLLERIKPHWKLIATIAGLVVLLGAILFTVDRCGSWSENKRDQKAKDEIANTAKEIANTNSQIANLELKQAELKGKLERDTEQLQKDIFGREGAKEQTNQALANFNRALQTNSNVDRSAEDLERILRELDK